MVMNVNIREKVNPVMDESRPKPHALYCEPGSSKTKQSFTEECDINEIVRRATAGQAVTHMESRTPLYGDFTGIPDYREALDLVHRAEGLFQELPWQVKERFANDPARMLEFLNNPANRDEAIKLGLVVPPKAEGKAGTAAAADAGASEAAPDQGAA